MQDSADIVLQEIEDTNKNMNDCKTPPITTSLPTHNTTPKH